MAKVERLAQLSNLIKKREAISVKEMSRACGVSQRTIYRYLKTLSKLGAPEQVFDGGAIRGRQDDAWKGLDAGDLDLIDFCLRHNPLTKYPYFLDRLSRVRRKLREQRSRSDRAESHFSLVEEEFNGPENTEQNEVLERFTRAKLDSRKVAITVKNAGSQPRVLIPTAIKISGKGIALQVSEHLGDDPEEINLSDITRLVVSAEPAGHEGRVQRKEAPSKSKTS